MQNPQFVKTALQQAVKLIQATERNENDKNQRR